MLLQCCTADPCMMQVARSAVKIRQLVHWVCRASHFRDRIKMLKQISTFFLLGLLAAPLSYAQERFAMVYKVQGAVTASNAQSGQVRTLREGDVVYTGELIRSEAQGEAVLMADDAGVMAVRPGTVFLVDQFVAKGGRHDAMTLRILRGGMRLITGWIGTNNKQSYRIVTPRATVGIRGTDHEPFVITADMAQELKQPEGTYDKVNSGGTLVASEAGDVQVSPGQAGFAPLTAGKSRTRALLTVLMPRILDRVPDFYRPGAFDDGLADLARRNMEAAKRSGALESDGSTAASSPMPPQLAAPVPDSGSASTASALCKQIASTWLADLDQALVRRDARAFMENFSADATITAVVRTSSGQEALLEFTREEMAASTLDAMTDLQAFSTQRVSVSVQETAAPGAAACAALHVEAVTIESGVRGGQAYRLESLETYELAQRDGKWIATAARTAQR